MGQLADFTMCNTGRGPESFQPLEVKALFSENDNKLNSIPRTGGLELKFV